MNEAYREWIQGYLHRNDPLGRCAEATKALVEAFPQLRRVAGEITVQGPFNTIHREIQHWWCVDEAGKVVDPTARQYFRVLEYYPYPEDHPAFTRPRRVCANCGQAHYGDDETVCSDECGEEYAKAITRSARGF